MLGMICGTEHVGMTSIKPINYNGINIQPLQFLKAVLPEPSSLGGDYTGETSIGCQIKGIKDGTFSEKDLDITEDFATTVMLVSKGYPEEYEKGFEIIDVYFGCFDRQR